MEKIKSLLDLTNISSQRILEKIGLLKYNYEKLYYSKGDYSKLLYLFIFKIFLFVKINILKQFFYLFYNFHF
ncbi:hypothetical protein DB44_FA00060 [Candidatus Protochlamydia amoebophila]|uniref:Uncharacterized protein n=1 Tax=Candidatus Protochlamydia amoebophila TaxID=362787 RepID=A0A0C1JHW8_9BACT|nr:hypothetical protein DB44_FA00060 [Candidatus Protochlamydia amoebophila]